MSRASNFRKVFRKLLECIKNVDVTVNNVHLEMNNLMSGKVCIVTGASRGIGFAVCKELINSGAVVVGLARDKQKLEEMSKTFGSAFIPYSCDISSIESIDKSIEEILDKIKTQHITTLINCAGTKNGNDERFFEFTADEYDLVMNVNAKAPFFWCQKIANYMITNGISGHIVNVASIKGFIGEASPYGLSKWSCVGLTQGLGRLLAPKGIIVNGVAPGGTATDMAHYNDGDSLTHFATSNLRLALPEEIAKTVVFLASDLGNNIVGQVIISDGGQSIQYGAMNN